MTIKAITSDDNTVNTLINVRFRIDIHIYRHYKNIFHVCFKYLVLSKPVNSERGPAVSAQDWLLVSFLLFFFFCSGWTYSFLNIFHKILR